MGADQLLHNFSIQKKQPKQHHSQHQQLHNPYVPNHYSAPAKRQGAFASANTIQTAVNGRPSNHLGLGTTPRMNNVNVGTNPSPNSEMSAAKPNLHFEGGMLWADFSIIYCFDISFAK